MDAAPTSPADAGVENPELLIAKLEHERDEYKKIVRLLQEENARLKPGLVGQKAERLPRNDAQLSLAILELMLGSDGSTLAPEPLRIRRWPSTRAASWVRKAFPEAWPRVPIEILPLEVQREGLDAFECIGSDTREVLERRPASTVVVQLVYKKVVRKTRSADESREVLTPETVELPIERGLDG